MIAQPARKICSFALTITMLGLFAACSSAPPSRAPVTAPDRGDPVRGATEQRSRSISPVGERAARIALNQVGVPYRYGGNSRNGFDCSGLVQFSYGIAGLKVPRTTGQLWSATTPVNRQNLRIGDLLFFSIEGKMSHVGLYLGEQRFVHAPSSGRTVSVESLTSPYYSRAFLRAGRPY